MSTRGLKGFKLDNKYYGTYNHHDSCPEGLGEAMLLDARQVLSIYNIEMVKANIRKLKEVGRDEFDEKNMYSSTRSDSYIMDLLSGKYESFHNEIDFMKDSLFCEYGYIIDFDDRKLMLFVGFQRTPQEGNMFGTESDNDGYYPCKYLGSIDVFNLSLDDAQKEMYEAYEAYITECERTTVDRVARMLKWTCKVDPGDNDDSRFYKDGDIDVFVKLDEPSYTQLTCYIGHGKHFIEVTTEIDTVLCGEYFIQDYPEEKEKFMDTVNKIKEALEDTK